MSRLLSSFGACGVALRNRVVVSHMAQYCAGAGKATDWSFAHLAAFATGSAALVFTESTQVEWPGLGSRDELYLWNDKHLESPRRITRFVRQAGAVPGTQLNHSGRMARAQRPWAGYDPRQSTERQLSPVIAPSACRHGERQARPREITRAYVREVIDAWVASTQLAVRAGFEVLEIYGAEGHLLHQFLAAAANHRTDERDGALANRMRSALEPTDAVRAFRPRDLPLFLRLSSTDDIGWTLDDSVALAAEHRACNVDVIDCSSGRMASRSPTTPNTSRGLSYQVPYATRIKRDAGIATMAVVLIARPQQAERILQEDASSLVELGREALLHPYWAGHAADALGADRDFGGWPRQYGWWLERRSRAENLDPEPTARSNSQE